MMPLLLYLNTFFAGLGGAELLQFQFGRLVAGRLLECPFVLSHSESLPSAFYPAVLFTRRLPATLHFPQ